MVFTTAMDTRNGSHYCYGDKEWVTLLLWRQGMGHTIAMKKRNGFTTAMETRNGLRYCYGDKEWISLLLWRRKMVYTTATETRIGFHYYMHKEFFSLLLLKIIRNTQYI